MRKRVCSLGLAVVLLLSANVIRAQVVVVQRATSASVFSSPDFAMDAASAHPKEHPAESW